eukprot:2199683-Amphidinium_carterae.1
MSEIQFLVRLTSVNERNLLIDTCCCCSLAAFVYSQPGLIYLFKSWAFPQSTLAAQALCVQRLNHRSSCQCRQFRIQRRVGIASPVARQDRLSSRSAKGVRVARARVAGWTTLRERGIQHREHPKLEGVVHLRFNRLGLGQAAGGGGGGGPCCQSQEEED